MSAESRRAVWITGASSGIGSALAETFAANGDLVFASARSHQKLEELRKRIQFQGGECEIVVCDVREPQSVSAAIATIHQKSQTVNVLINNAGVSSFKDFSSTEIDEFDQVLDTNLRGSFLTTKSVLSEMLEQQKGLVINILSYVTKEVFPQSAAYSASKAGLEAMMNVLRAEVRRKGINIVNVYPGAVLTPIWHPKVQEKYKAQMLDASQLAVMIYQVSIQPPPLAVEEIVLRPQSGNLQI
jgi:short-subunit dehydrogenase